MAINKVKMPDRLAAEGREALKALLGKKSSEATHAGKVACDLTLWNFQLNECISIFNMILDDLKLLGLNKDTLSGSCQTRIKFLIRSFFSESYRFREIFFEMLSSLKKDKLIDRSAILTIKETFLTVFDDILKLRNLMTHQAFDWNDELISLGPACMLDEIGITRRSLTEKENEEEQDRVKKVTKEVRERLLPVGTALSEFFSFFIVALESVIFDNRSFIDVWIQLFDLKEAPMGTEK